MRCDICGQDEARIRYVSETFGKGHDLLVIEDIPLITCLHCGESYFTAQTLHEIEHIKRHRKSLAVPRLLEVAKFAV